MLEQILDYIHNYFVKDIHEGDFVISNKELSDVDFLIDGQYYKIVGSVLNDGIYRYPDDELVDESFSGQIWAMAVPPAVIALSDEIQNWVNKYGSVMYSPYNSESFGGYSYTKSNGSSNGSMGSSDWRYVFGSRLNRWRKIS